MRQCCIFFMSLLFGLLSSSVWAETNQSLNQQLAQVTAAQRIKYDLPALSVSILLPGDKKPRNYVSGFMTLAKKQKITPNALFQMGSNTKLFTATVILKLAEEGKLSVNDKLGKWLPQYPKWSDITIWQLLTHTSGVYKVIDTKDFWQNLKAHPTKYWSLQTLANLAYQYPDYFEPGKGYNYSNTEYILLGLIIEKITHQSINQVFKSYLFKKFGLNNTYYTAEGYPKKIINQLAHGYDDEGTFGYNVDVTDVSTSFASTAGAIVSTPQDIILFLQQLFAGKIISSKYLQLMHQLFSPKTGQPILIGKKIKLNATQLKPWLIGQGMGIEFGYVKPYGFIWAHPGGMPGYQSFYTYNPCKGIYVVLAYSEQPKKIGIFNKVAQPIFDILDKSSVVKTKVKAYKKTHVIPAYCSSKVVN